MKGFNAITFGVVLAVGILGLSGQALAATTTVSDADSYFFSNDITSFKLTNYESAFEGGWSDTPADWVETNVVGVGTYLRGIFKITQSKSSGSSGVIDFRNPDGTFELTGEFSGYVASATTPDANGFANFTLTPDAAFEAKYGTGAMVAFYEGAADNFSTGGEAGGTITSSHASAVDGSLYMVLGAPAGGVFGTDYFWNANGNVTPGVSTFAASLDLLVNNTKFADGSFKVLTQEAANGGLAAWGDIENVFGLQGNTVTNPISSSPWALQSEDPIRANVVPLPAASMVGAMMLLGMLGLRIRKSRRQA